MAQKLKHSTEDIGRSFVQLISENISRNGEAYFDKVFAPPFKPKVDKAAAGLELFYGVLANLFQALPNVFDKEIAAEIEMYAKSDITERTRSNEAAEIIQGHQVAIASAKFDTNDTETIFAADEALARSVLSRCQVPLPHQTFEILLVTAALTDFAPNLKIIKERIVL